MTAPSPYPSRDVGDPQVAVKASVRAVGVHYVVPVPYGLASTRALPRHSNNRDNVELRGQYLALRAAPVPPQLGFKQSAFTIHALAD